MMFFHRFSRYGTYRDMGHFNAPKNDLFFNARKMASKNDPRFDPCFSEKHKISIFRDFGFWRVFEIHQIALPKNDPFCAN